MKMQQMLLFSSHKCPFDYTYGARYIFIPVSKEKMIFYSNVLEHHYGLGLVSRLTIIFMNAYIIIL